MKKLIAVLAVVAVFGLATAQAGIVGGDVIKLDFSTFGDGDGGGANLADWNQVSTGVNESGIAAGSVIRHGDGAVVTGVSISFANLYSDRFNDGAAVTDGWGGQASDPYYTFNAVDDIYYHLNTATVNFSTTFGGLDPSLTYNVRIYCLGDSNPTITRRFVVTDGAGTQSVQNARGFRWAAATLEAGGTVFSGLSVNGTNEIVVTFEKVAVSTYPLNAIVLEAVGDPIPEPAGLGLLGVGLLGLRRRRS